MCLKGCCGLVCAFRWKKKTNFESVSVSQNLVIFQKKHKKGKFCYFFFDPLFFRSETDKLPKKSHQLSQMTKMLTKKILVTLEQKNPQFRTPPYRPLWGGEGRFEICT
jgi:uncharacterized membrane protein